MKRAQLSRIAIWGALLATLYLTFESARQSEDDPAESVSIPVRTSPRIEAMAVQVPSSPTALPKRHWNEAAAHDPFQTMRWYVPSRLPMAKPPRPQAPPVPYKYFGKMMEGDMPQAFLYQGDRVIVVKVGDVLANTYQIERIAPDTISLTYLPLGTRQTVLFGEREPELATAAASGMEVDTAESKPEKVADGAVNVQAIQEMVRQATLKTKE